MKTYRHLWPQICSFENLHDAWRRARRGKNGKRQIVRFESDLEDNLVALQQELQSGSYQPGTYTNFRARWPRSAACWALGSAPNGIDPGAEGRPTGRQRPLLVPQQEPS